MEDLDMKENSRQLAGERDRYRAIFQSMAEPAFVVDHSFRIITVNKAFERFFGAGEAEVTGKKCSDVINYDLCEACPLADAMRGKTPFTDIEASLIVRGDKKIVLVSGSAIGGNGSAAPIGIVVIQDITERKQKDEALREKELQQKAILRNIPDIAWLKDNESRFIAVNEAFGEACGLRPDDLVGKTDLDIWPEPLARRYRADDREVISTGRRKQVEEPLEDSTGQQIWIETIKTPIYDEDGKIIGTTGVARDITGRKQMEEALRHLAAQQKAILDNIAGGVFLLKSRELKWANRKAAELFGYSLEEIVGKDTSIFYPDRESFEQFGHEAYPLLAQGKAYSKEKHMKKKNGELIWCSIIGQAVNAADPEQGSIWMLDDITERKTAEQRLQLLHSAVSTSRAGITFRDTNNIIIFTNDAEARMHGYDKSELLGRPAHILSPPDLRRDMNIEKMGSISGWERERISIRKDGTTFPVRLVSDVVKDELGNPLGLVTICEDISERKKIEEELTLHKNQLEHLVSERTAEFMTAINFLQEEIEFRKQTEEALKENEAKMRHLHGMKVLGELAAGVAHEVRNPLHALMSVTEALKKELEDNPDYDIFLLHIREQVERLSVLMKDLLDLGKPIEPSHLRPESLSEICLASIDLWKKSPSRRGHSISFVQPPEGNVIVAGDSQRLQQVFLNLLENAAHHSPEGSEIQVVMQAPAEDSVRVHVIDMGSGIPEEILPRIFEPFFTTRRRGIGLGLAIIKNILEGHRGSLAVRNNHPLPGCTAEVNLPCAKGAKQ